MAYGAANERHKMSKHKGGIINFRGGFDLADFGYTWTLKDVIVDQFCDHCQVWVSPTTIERQEPDTGSWCEIQACPTCGRETSKTEEM
jgi:hypothetical protein